MRLQSARLAAAITCFSVVLAGLSYAIALVNESASTFPSSTPGLDPTQSWLSWSITTTILLAFLLVGGLIAVKRPENGVGWAMLLGGSGSMLGSPLGAYAQLALLAKPEWDLPGGALAGAFNEGGWQPLLAGVFLLLVLFPTGRTASVRWRWLTRLTIAGFAMLWILSIREPRLAPPLQSLNNPLAVGGSGFDTATTLITGACLSSTAIAAIGMVLRFLNSRGEERIQFRFLALAGVFLVASLPIGAVSGYRGVPSLALSAALLALPGAVGIAVLRYRLYDIDRIINRTLVYGFVTTLLALTYFGLVIGLQSALNSFSRGSGLAVAITTLVVAVLFFPLRQQVQAVVDKRFNRHVYDGARTIEAFSARLRQQIDLDSLRDELLSVVDETMEPAGVSLWLREPRR